MLARLAHALKNDPFRNAVRARASADELVRAAAALEEAL
jgi:hypothetical protein